MIDQTYIVIFLALAAVIILLYFALSNKDGKQLEKRMQKVSRKRGEKSDKRFKDRNKDTKRSVLQRDTHKTKLDDYLEALGTSRNSSRSKLVQAGLDINVVTFLFIRLIVGGIVAMIVLFTIKPLLPYAIAAGVAAGIILPTLYLKKKIRKRVLAFELLFPDALEQMERGLKTGMPITQTIKSVAENVDAPVGPEFHRLYNDIKFGVPLNEAIWTVADRMPTQEYNFFAVSVALQSETGGNLAENLSRLGEVLRSRVSIRRMITSKSAEARWSGRVIAALPVFFVGAVYVMSPDFLNPLFYDPRGKKMLYICIGMILTGILMMRRMTRFDF